MNISKETHLQNLLGSIETMFTNARNKGIIKNKELYLLNLVAKLVNYDEINEVSDKYKKELSIFYFKLLRKYNKILCNNLPIKKFIHVSQILNTIYEQSSCDNIEPCYDTIEPDKIYWWQELTYDNDETETIAAPGFFSDKLFDSETNFATGVDCLFTDVGYVFFAIMDSKNADNYQIYDALNNNITHTFSKIYSNLMECIIFVSNNIYSHSTTNLKIIKI
jgi:hypothetical protein